MWRLEGTAGEEGTEKALNGITGAIIGAAIEVHKRFRLDTVVDGQVLVEIKAVKHLLPVHEAQIVSYLRLASLHLGLLINFHHTTLTAGLRRFRASVPSSPSAPSTNQRKETN